MHRFYLFIIKKLNKNRKSIKIIYLFNGDWGLGIGPNPQSPIPNPQSPIPFKKEYIQNLILFNSSLIL